MPNEPSMSSALQVQVASGAHSTVRNQTRQALGYARIYSRGDQTGKFSAVSGLLAFRQEHHRSTANIGIFFSRKAGDRQVDVDSGTGLRAVLRSRRHPDVRHLPETPSAVAAPAPAPREQATARVPAAKRPDTVYTLYDEEDAYAGI
ncbi:hypothetical protein NUW54_g6643 [Trametes sanguinea]|uniref:Uncharacterized protein n=1 Tax=Trametes sanguinea TaxID=158606 RepID=A0ACC1PRR5_9APHY|nr:hypothetical protein NUW54_g6643 [Trametes sanguinea]